MRLSSLFFATTSAKICNEYLLTGEKSITLGDEIVTDIHVKKQFSVSFDLNLDGVKTASSMTHGWESVLFVGDTSYTQRDCERNMASVMIYPDSVAKIAVFTCANGIAYGYHTKDDLDATFNQKWATISVDHHETPDGHVKMSIEVNGEKVDIQQMMTNNVQPHILNTSPTEPGLTEFIIGDPGLPSDDHIAEGKIRNLRYSTGDFGENVDGCKAHDHRSCVAEPSKCLKVWADSGFPTKRKDGKNAAKAYWKCMKKNTRQTLGKKPKKHQSPPQSSPQPSRSSCKWADCVAEYLEGKTWSDFDQKAWKKCARTNMKYMRFGK